MTSGDFRIVPMGPDNLSDRLRVCWSHLENWEKHDLVRQTKAWLEKVNKVFSPSTFIAYDGKEPVGMIEFMPRDMLHDHDFCPCRKRSGSGALLPMLATEFRDHLFIACLWVPGAHQQKGVGKALLNQLLESDTFKHFRGALVFVSDRDSRWPEAIHWPAGPREFYENAGFRAARRIEEPPGYLLRYDRKSRGF